MNHDFFPGYLQMPVSFVTAPARYTGICIGGPLHDTELTSTEKTHRISVPEGKTVEKSPGHYTRFFRQMEYNFRNGQWEYQG